MLPSSTVENYLKAIFIGEAQLPEGQRLLTANVGLSAGADGVLGPDDWANLAAAVPEPASLAVAPLLAASLATRRRRPKQGR